MSVSTQLLQGSACIITGGLLTTHHAKTAHGLIRESKRFQIHGIIDADNAGKSIKEIFPGASGDYPVYSSVLEMIHSLDNKPKYAIIGMATKGGILPESLYPVVQEALTQGIEIINGLHQPLNEVEQLRLLSEQYNAKIHDIRKPKPFAELKFWSGKINEVTALKIGVLGTDCAVGKRTTTTLLLNALNQANIRAEMIYTGQTGWMQGVTYGFIFDATPNDFIPGELENAIYQCWQNEKPEVILVEGQASLRNPGGPCGSEFIISGELDGVILQHHPPRKKFSNLDHYPANVPDVLDEIALIKTLGCATWAITLNTSGMNNDEIKSYQKTIEEKSGLPVICPLEDGAEKLVEVIIKKTLVTK